MSTIVALSTPTGRGAIAIVRLSGPESRAILRALTPEFDNVKARRATLARIRVPASSETVDEALVTYFPAPHSVTGEDVVELACHGSPIIVRQIIDLALEAGALLAGPGEFTLRALSNRKINLAQAEAIRDLIAAQTNAAVKQASRQIGGELSNTLQGFQSTLIKIIVLLESALEFVEDDLPLNERQTIEDSLKTVRQGVSSLANSFASGRLLQDGIKVAIVGSPNVGKSSLFNRLVEQDRAIVTHMPGTTRDTLSEAIDIGGIPVVLTDTAGLRETDDSIESLGIERTLRALSDADLVLEVIDATDCLTERLQTPGVPSIAVLNKCDLLDGANAAPVANAIKLSALTGEGLDLLRTAILDNFKQSDQDNDGLLITNARHHDLLRSATTELDQALELISCVSEELVLVPLHNALKCLGAITGETTTEDILTQIFATFCIGK